MMNSVVNEVSTTIVREKFEELIRVAVYGWHKGFQIRLLLP